MPISDPPIVIEFRDGERSIPAHVAHNLAVSGIDPVAYTFEEAVKIADKALERNFINDFQARMVQAHFRDNR